MRRVILLASLVVLAVACTDQPLQDPTAPTPTAATPAGPTARADLTLNPTAQIRLQILQLFPLGGGLLIAQAAFEVIVLQMNANPPKTTQAQALAQQLINFTTKQYAAGVLFGGQSPGTLSKVAALVSALDVYVGLQPAVPSGTTDVGLGVVSPSPTDTSTVFTQNGYAGVAVPGTAVNVPTLVTIYAVPSLGPLKPTSLDQYGPYYQFTSSAGGFTKDVTAGICANYPGPGAAPSTLRLAHNPDPGETTITILPSAPSAPLQISGGLNCLTYLTLGPSQDSRNFAVRGLRAFGNEIANLLSPEPLFAYTSAPSGTGTVGTTKNFSTFGVVNIATNLTANSPTSFSAAVGTVVATPNLPSVKVTTPNGIPIQGDTVNFSIPSGQGSISGTFQLTNSSGVATLGSWTLGPAAGPNNVLATVTPITGDTVINNPILFVATGVVPAAPFDWSNTGWSYLSLGAYSSSVPPDPTAAVNPATTYSGPVTAAFSMAGDLGNSQCSVYSTNASWIHSTVFAQNTVVAFRRNFVLPNGATSGTMYFAIDNDLKVFVNGVDMTPYVVFQSGGSGSSTGYNSGNTFTGAGTPPGFVNHDGCPNRGDFALSLSNLSTLSNTVVIIALDRGGSTYFDASVTP